MFQSVELFIDKTLRPDELVRSIADLRYRRVNRVMEQGEFSQRGSIVDIYPVDFDAPLRVDLENDHVRSIATINSQTGRPIWQHKIVIILPARPCLRRAAGGPNRPPARSVFNADVPLNNFLELQKGDYVVHNNHGIGRYLGIAPVDAARGEKEHMVIEYKGDDKLFVPVHDMHLVQKYVGFHKKPPRLYPLGSKEWKRVRALIQKRLQRLAGELLHAQAARASLKGFAFSPDVDWQKEFEKKFPFEETPDQTKATLEVKKDMESVRPMDRLLCGDVGYGKTEVALRAAFKAVMDNKQVVVLVPTTILAEQHYYNFSNRLKDFPVKVAMLSRFRARGEQTATLKELREGGVDIVIGTHRLLSRDIAFKDIGLIIIDEEQRFGVRAKERLKQFRLLTDVLMLTATPIPRTLYMALTGVRDMSVIATPPQSRIAVKTAIVEFDEELIQTAIDRELKRKGQIFFLHNRVEDIERIVKIITRLVPRARTGIAHGQMLAHELEDTMLKFLKGMIDVLVCTTIIESGIDVPNANTLIVNRADRFGLSDLHQLRGRVGRFTRKAYAYFIIPPRGQLSAQAKARVDAVEKHSGLGAGFQIAFEDLQIRGAGNILGQEQHGYIATIGFDLYCRLLKESVEHLKHEMAGTSHGTLN
ncbi:MAG: transcription-repair coupling factor [Candidatus Omnitrophica bacterium]|nr:transcription-repair coupling factor [Candidatus Omnitrophota bacterium]